VIYYFHFSTVIMFGESFRNIFFESYSVMMKNTGE